MEGIAQIVFFFLSQLSYVQVFSMNLLHCHRVNKAENVTEK